ncbi:MAG: hypothetical protein ACLGG7_05720 [Bacteriovoracia bacterium]
MRELRITKIQDRTYLYPVPVFKDRKYLVLCESEAQAQLVIQQVREKKLSHPDLISEDFVFLTYHTDQQTKIFVPRLRD